MKSDVERWLREYGEAFLKNVGIRKGHTVLDFGCGSGYYTIPAARIVGNRGRVYALDKNGERLKRIAEMAASENLSNVTIVQASTVSLDDASMDVVLLYDVIHSHHFSPFDREELLHGIYAVSKPGALISVYPHHMDREEAYNELVRANFLFEKKLFTTLLHNRTLVEDHVLNFRKR